MVSNELREVQAEVERSLAGRLRGNFFSINLDNVRKSLEEIPFARCAEVCGGSGRQACW